MNPLHVEQDMSKAVQRRTDLSPPEAAVSRPLFEAWPAAVDEGSAHRATGRLVVRNTSDLKWHPALVEERLKPSEERLLALEKLGEALFEDPLSIAREGWVIDGYARWQLAARQKRPTLRCVELPLTEPEALLRILRNQFRRPQLPPYVRVHLALHLEPYYRELALARQRAGGKGKLSSNLTEACRIDCRREIAQAAGVSVGNVTKVRQIDRVCVAPEIIGALHSGEISIHFAWKLRVLCAAKQQAALGSPRAKLESMRRIKKLVSKHLSKDVAGSLYHLQLGMQGLRAAPSMVLLWEPIGSLLDRIEHLFTEQ